MIQLLGIHDVPHDDYHGGAGVSKSGLDLIEYSPAKFKCQKIDGIRPPPTPAMITGAAVHCAVLEPEVFEQRYVVAPKCDRRTTKGKEIWAKAITEHAGAEVITAEIWEMSQDIGAAIQAHPAARELLSDGVAEQSAYWIDEQTGVYCKCRPDWVYGDQSIVVDLKTTKDARPFRFKWDMKKYRYHVQAAFYSDGLRACGVPVEHFLFLAVEKDPPYLCSIVDLTDTDLDIGQMAYYDNLATYKQCMESGVWPGLPTDVTTVTLS